MSDGYVIERTRSGARLSYPGALISQMVEVAPGVVLAHHRVTARELPPMELQDMGCAYLINHVRRGVCEMRTQEGGYVCVKGGDLCVSREQATDGFDYPTGTYEGLEVYVFDTFRGDASKLLKSFDVDVDAIAENYLSAERGTFVSRPAGPLVEPLRAMYALFDQDIADSALLRIHGLLVLRLLTAALPDLRPLPVSTLTPAQVAMAKQTERLLIAHLDRRIPIRSIAENLGVSETGLKNHFRAVFGQNVSDYLRRARMERAKELLRGGSDPIGEVARLVGYRNQSRFDAAFRAYAGCTPSQWRKQGTSC